METINYQHFPLPCSATVLPNGLTVITAASTLPTARVALHFAVGCGENGACPGLSHFLEHLIFEGPSRDYVHPKLRHLLPKGVEGYAGSSESETEYALTGYADDLSAMIEALGQICFVPAFDQKSVDEEREVIRAEIIGIGKRDDFFFWSLQAMFPAAAPFHLRPAGTIESLDAITRQRLLAHHARYYAPNNAALIVVSAVTPEQVLAAAGQLEKVLPPPADLPARLVPEITRATANYAAPDEPPSIRLYFDQPSSKAENVFLNLATEMLVSPPLGLIFRELRSRRRMIYGTGYHVGAWPLRHTAIIIEAAATEHFPVIIEVAADCLRQLSALDYEPELLEIIRARELRRQQEEDASLPANHGGYDDYLTGKWLAGELRNDPDFPHIIANALPVDIAAAAAGWLNPDNCGFLFAGPT